MSQQTGIDEPLFCTPQITEDTDIFTTHPTSSHRNPQKKSLQTLYIHTFTEQQWTCWKCTPCEFFTGFFQFIIIYLIYGNFVMVDPSEIKLLLHFRIHQFWSCLAIFLMGTYSAEILSLITPVLNIQSTWNAKVLLILLPRQRRATRRFGSLESLRSSLMSASYSSLISHRRGRQSVS